MNQTYITLNDDNKIPQFGLGVFMVPGDERTEEACLKAFKLGYRHIDTAHAYQNERGVGKAVRESGINRNEIWITSKLWPSEYGEEKSYEGIKKMLARMGLDYIDMVILHQQFGDYLGAYRGMERAKKEGLVRSIGLSNFESSRLEDVLEKCDIKPAVLQVECHPYYQQHDLKKRIEKYGTVIESWYPIGHGDKGLINEPIFTELGKKYHKSNVQIILRWHIQEGNIVFPKTENVEHMKENIDIFDFALTLDEMAEIRKLDCGKRFFNQTLEQQEATLSKFVPAD